MTTFTLVRPEHLNHYGYLFGGNLLKWVDECAWMAASREFPGCPLVTVAMNDVVFKEKVRNGSILRFSITWLRQGTTSVTYAVQVFAHAPGVRHEKLVFSTEVTFVHVDARGRKKPLPVRHVTPRDISHCSSHDAR
ncbi:MAG: acyl-CoA thioesterase [bacterium]|nr:acyl-CoA thioesterase [bacterium]